MLIPSHSEVDIERQRSTVQRSAHSFLIKQAGMAGTGSLSLFPLSLSDKCAPSSAGPPLPPQEVQVQCGQTPGFLQVRWKPPPLTSSGTSNGASVIGYAVCTKGQKVTNKKLLLLFFFSLTLQILKWVASAFLSCNFSVALYCHLLEKVFNVHMQPRGMRNKQVCPGSLFLQAIFVMHTYVSSNYIFILF